MKDDYLWDGSGEPDSDIEQLEKLLGSYRHQTKPLDARFEQQLGARRNFFWVKYAAAAAILMMALMGAWLLVPGNLPASDLQAIAEMPELPPLPGEGIVDLPPPNKSAATTSVSAPTPAGKRNAPPVHVKKPAPLEPDVINHTKVNTAAAVAGEMAVASPIVNPFVDAETARHIERAQALLRSFRNTEGDAGFDVA